MRPLVPNCCKGADMKLLKHLLLLLLAFLATPVLAEPITVVVGDSNAVNSSGLWTHGMDTTHADFYVEATSGWGVDQLQSNISSINSHGTIEYLIVAIGTNDAGSGAYADAAAWVADLYSFYASIRSANPGVKILQFTLGPRTGDATYTSRRQTINDTLRADERNGTGPDYLIDIAANPTMSSTTANSDTNLYIAEAAIVHYAYCTGACTVTAPASGYTSGDVCYGTLGSAKGHNYIMKQVECALQSVRAGKYPWTVYPQTVTYSASPVVPTAESAPALTLAQPADIATSVSLTGWTSGTSITATTLPPGDTPKFRTVINSTNAARLDPVRNPGDAIAGHCHLFFGNASVDENSTYTTLRATGASTAAGGPINVTGYWEPCMTKANAFGGDGITRVKIPNYHIVYYVGTANIQSQYNVIPRGLRYIGGTHMDDPSNVFWKAELNANVTWAGNGLTNPNTGWFCESPQYQSTTDALVNADGTDALNNCPSSSAIYVSVLAPECWDGVNLRSANGYDHMRPYVNNAGSGQPVCPDNWYRLPRLEVKSFFSHQGASDYINWRLDSDDMMAATLGSAVKSGFSFHFDWFGAWDYAKMLLWMDNCIGTRGNTAHECDSSTASTTERFVGGISDAAPDGSRNPQVNLGHTYAGDLVGDWFDYPAMEGGMMGGSFSKARARLRIGVGP